MSKTQQRRDAILDLLQEYSDGMSPSQLGEALGVTRQTIQRYLKDFISEGVVDKVEGTNRYALNYHNRHRPMGLSRPHTWLLYLLLRQFVRANLHQDSQVKQLLHKLASSLHEEVAHYLVYDTSDTAISESAFDSERWDIIVGAWYREMCIKLNYQTPGKRSISQLVVEPWWFEPAPWSDGFYLIGRLRTKEDEDKTITLKLNRIRSVHVTGDHFCRPEPQRVFDYIESTWGIWGGGEPQEVVLRFHNRQKQRLAETRWHPNQQVEQKGGWIVWKAKVAEPKEMVPWIRGWGADVEVLTPQSLRDAITGEVRALARLYKVDGSGREDLRNLFGK